MDKTELRRELSNYLLEETDTSRFMQRAYELHCKARPKTNFAEWARKMGFSSRSFVRQLAVGSRKPNLQNFRKIAKGLGLSPEATDYFGLLIENQSQNSTDLEKRLLQAELRLRKSLQKNIRRISQSDPVPFERWPFIYAALGPSKVGRSFQEILQISGQSHQVCTEILEFLVKKEIVIWNSKTQRYYPKEEIIDIGDLGSSAILKNLFKMITLEAIRRIDTELKSQNSLFHSAVFSIKASQLPQLTKELQELMNRFMAEAEEASGEELAILSTCLLPLKK